MMAASACSSSFWEDRSSLESLGSCCSQDGLGSGSPDALRSVCDLPLSWLCLSDCPPPVYPFNGDGFDDLDTHSSVVFWERHVFLCFKEPQFWASSAKGFHSDRLPRALSAAIKFRKDEINVKTRLIICEGRDGTESSNGDVLIFPDMICYRGLTHFDVDAFVEEVLVHNRKWLPGRPKKLSGTHIFVCTYLNPSWCDTVQAVREHMTAKGLPSSISIKPCAYFEGCNKYRGNLIIYGFSAAGEVLGHCYGYVTPQNVSSMLDDLLQKGYMLAEYGGLRMQGALSEQATQNQTQHSQNTLRDEGRRLNSQIPVEVRSNWHDTRKDPVWKRRIYTSSKWWQTSWWFDFWEKEDTLAAFVVICAAASVGVANYIYRAQKWQ